MFLPGGTKLKQTIPVDALGDSLLDAGSIPAASIIWMFRYMIHRTSLFIFLILIHFSVFPLKVAVRLFDHKDHTRVVFQGDRAFAYNVDLSTPRQIGFLCKEKATVEKKVFDFNSSQLVNKVVHQVKHNRSRFTVQLKSPFKIKRSFVLEQPFRVVFDIVRSQEETPQPTAESKTKSREPPTQEIESEPPVRNRSIELICIDAGHGGSDFGAIGKSKTMEKEITLKLTQKLKRMITSKLGLRVILTRDSDEEVSLNKRAAIANNNKAQLFVSIHINGSHRKGARGSETYFVSLKATDQESFELAQKENKSFEEIDKMAEDNELKMILWNMAQTEYIKESSILAEFIQNELNVLLHTRNRGVKQAPFRVLMRAAMPAVLVEAAFISNPYEEIKLKGDAFLDKIADALYRGISIYINYYNKKNQ